jgi:two-component system sensor histidine kinase QseC
VRADREFLEAGPGAMSLQRRLILYLLVCAPIIWTAALAASVHRARHEVDEMFDTGLIRLARQLQVTVGASTASPSSALPDLPSEGTQGAGESDIRDLAMAIWDRDGRRLVADRSGAELPYHRDATGFTIEKIHDEDWRIYYLQSASGDWLIAAGQKVYERDEMVFGLTTSQVLPWVAVLPILLLAMSWGVRRALAPLRDIGDELRHRQPDELRPLDDRGAPFELKPLIGAMNGLFSRIETMLKRERRFTADAAHELRTPLAVLRAQWDVVRRSQDHEERAAAEAKLTAGMDRMGRLVTQMLALSRLEASQTVPRTADVRWQPIVEQVVDDCLELADQRRVELAVEWPPASRHPMPLLGEESLIVMMLRNLVDNAVRYARTGSTVSILICEDQLAVENVAEVPPSPEQLARLGERFYRPEGPLESGSGLGISIARRIAALHGLQIDLGLGADGSGVRATLRYADTRTS